MKKDKLFLFKDDPASSDRAVSLYTSSSGVQSKLTPITNLYYINLFLYNIDIDS